MSGKKRPRAGLKRNRQAACVELDAQLNIAQAADLHRTLLARLAKGGPVIVDGARVEEIDTAMLQLLASLWRTSRERGIDCTWKGASAALRQTAALIGVSEALNFPAGEPV
ncbi:MAG: lipid asymmetry maintenance protein MlaB [Steroidobacteraceae bacterium]